MRANTLSQQVTKWLEANIELTDYDDTSQMLIGYSYGRQALR